MTEAQMELLLAYDRQTSGFFSHPTCVGLKRSLIKTAEKLHEMGYLCTNGRGSYIISTEGRDAAEVIREHKRHVTEEEALRKLLVDCGSAIAKASASVQESGRYPSKDMTLLLHRIRDSLRS